MPADVAKPPMITVGASSAIPSIPAITDRPTNLKRPRPSDSGLFPDLESRIPDNPERMPLMITWEYITTPLLLHKETAILNTWGSEGWELVQIVDNKMGGNVAFFKRPVAAKA